MKFSGAFIISIYASPEKITKLARLIPNHRLAKLAYIIESDMVNRYLLSNIQTQVIQTHVHRKD